MKYRQVKLARKTAFSKFRGLTILLGLKLKSAHDGSK